MREDFLERGLAWGRMTISMSQPGQAKKRSLQGIDGGLKH